MILIRDNIEKTVDTEEAAMKLIAKGFRKLQVPAGGAPVKDTGDVKDGFKTGSAGFRDSAEAPGPKDFHSMKVQELRTLARAKGVSGTGAMTKAELIELLEE